MAYSSLYHRWEVGSPIVHCVLIFASYGWWHRHAEEREMTADEWMYDVMLRWSQNEFFLFKRRPVKNLLRHKSVRPSFPFGGL